MLPYIYPEIYEHILRQLPVHEGFGDDSSARALAQCAAASSTLRSIACLSHIWRPHYEARWKHHAPPPPPTPSSPSPSASVTYQLAPSSNRSSPSPPQDPSRSTPISSPRTSTSSDPSTSLSCGASNTGSPASSKPYIHTLTQIRGTHSRRSSRNSSSSSSSSPPPDYRVLYIQRWYRDRQALDALACTVVDRTQRYELSHLLVDDLGMDVWDVLADRRSRIDAPGSFRPRHSPSEDWLAQSHWIDEIMATISRREAIERVVRICTGDSEDMSLEEGLSIFSGFWGVRYSEIASMLDALALECRTHIEDQLNLTLDAVDAKYDRIEIILAICSWMRSKGYGPAIEDYHLVWNSYLHKVLTSNKKSIPLSLSAIFIALCRRLDIPASPVSLPGHAHAFVPLSAKVSPRSPYASHYDSVQNGIHVDIYSSATTPFVDLAQVAKDGQTDRLRVSSTHDMVFRSAKNILSCAQIHQSEISTSELDIAIYGVFCLFVQEERSTNTPPRDFVHHITQIVGQNYQLDIGPVLLRRLAPALVGEPRQLMMNECKKLIDEDAQKPRKAQRGAVRYFSGLVFVHRIFDYVAVILDGDDHCHATNTWIIRFGIDALERGRHQPFYTVCAADGSARYVAEDNIIPISCLDSDLPLSAHKSRTTDEILRSLVQGYPNLGRHFLRPIDGPEKRAVFMPVPETFVRFPDDETKVAQYLKTGECPPVHDP
ncbi:hypothetical protein DL93DRAFT_2169364 [Clavulina sp. PMI_390]|nr:hypothetical protein DL93DRAFT_2169364 [Clavulina sp. PMI_390]